MRKMIVSRALELAIYFLIPGRPTCSLAHEICITSHYPRQGSLPFVKLCCTFCAEREEKKMFKESYFGSRHYTLQRSRYFSTPLFEEVQTYLN